jgi:hypothetical protein
MMLHDLPGDFALDWHLACAACGDDGGWRRTARWPLPRLPAMRYQRRYRTVARTA